jgi:hypothetical protein
LLATGVVLWVSTFNRRTGLPVDVIFFQVREVHRIVVLGAGIIVFQLREVRELILV